MPSARNRLISLEDTPYYHCICRCVRRAFLWGEDTFSGRNYSHRKQWVVDRLNLLSDVLSKGSDLANFLSIILFVEK